MGAQEIKYPSQHQLQFALPNSDLCELVITDHECVSGLILKLAKFTKLSAMPKQQKSMAMANHGHTVVLERFWPLQV